MTNETLFYLCGGVLALSAVTLAFVGLKVKGFPGRALPIVIVWFAIFVGGATTFAVLHAQDEEAAEASELEHAGEEIEKAEHDEPEEIEKEDEKASEGSGTEEAAGGASTTLALAADPTDLAFDTTELEAKAGEVTIDFDNPSAIPHNVVIEKDGEELAGFEPIAEGEEAVSAELEPGTYTFLCTVPGHAQAGMEGTLVVK
jgi:plastocyanin